MTPTTDAKPRTSKTAVMRALETAQEALVKAAVALAGRYGPDHQPMHQAYGAADMIVFD